MRLKASDIFKVLETDFSFGNDTSNSNSSKDNDNDSTLENPYDMFPSEDNLLYTDDLMKQCDKILTEYPALDDFTKSNYITEEFIVNFLLLKKLIFIKRHHRLNHHLHHRYHHHHHHLLKM